jgi:hypothetical protein
LGLDRLKPVALLLVLPLAASCAHGGRPKRLLDGAPALEFRPVAGSVIVLGRVLRGTTLGRRFLMCRRGSAPRDALVVERIAVFAESLTFVDRRHKTVYACDGGVDPAGEHRPPWCGGSAGLLVGGRLLDPRLDVACRDRGGRPLAYAWVEPVAAAHWIGVDQGSYAEVYEVLAGLPVRVATTRNVRLESSSATFSVTQYDAHGRELVAGSLEARVAG